MRAGQLVTARVSAGFGTIIPMRDGRYSIVYGRVRAVGHSGTWVDIIAGPCGKVLATLCYAPSDVRAGAVKLREDHQLCALCATEAPGAFRLVDDRRMFICDPCEHDHPREGRYSFDEGGHSTGKAFRKRGIG